MEKRRVGKKTFCILVNATLFSAASGFRSKVERPNVIMELEAVFAARGYQNAFNNS